MSHYTQILYQVVFHTKGNKSTLNKAGRQTLYDYFSGILKKKNCFCYQIGGIENHVHLVFSLHPTVTLSQLVQDLKVSSNKMIKEKGIFPKFESWSNGYSAFTYRSSDKATIIRYVQKQEEHHATKNYATELRELCKEENIEIDERYFLLE